MKFSIMRPGEEQIVINIVKEAFDASVALSYNQDGIEEFYKFANENCLAERSKIDCFTIIAYHNQQAVGIIEIKEYCHISMFFVRPKYQKNGYGKALLNEALCIVSKQKNTIGKITVNSSLNAVPTYEGFGFKATNKEQCYNGIRFIPMELIF